MGSPPVKKKLRVIEDEDRISKLSDDLINKIISFLDAKEALQTSALSKRWKLIWTTLPVLNFGWYEHSSPQNTYDFIRHVLSNRNHQSNISELKLCSSQSKPRDSLVKKFVEYAIEHNVQHLNLKLCYRHDPFRLSTLSSNSLKKLTLQVKLADFTSEPCCWDLPALTFLHLVPPLQIMEIFYKLPGSCLTCLPALTTLWLDYWDLSLSSFSFSLPHLTTLRLSGCTKLPRKVWNFPALSSLELDTVDFPKNVSHIFSSLVNLKYLTLVLKRSTMELRHSISCPQLLNLNIRIFCSDSLYGNIKFLAPKLCNFISVGILSITLEAPKLENVHIKSNGWWFGNVDWIYRKKMYRLFTDMLSGLGNTKNLTFDSSSIKALSAADFLASLPSPFCNLKIVKLPLGYKESSISSDLRSYLLGGSPRATIVTTLPQSSMIPKTVAVSMIAQNAVLEGSLAAPTKDMNVQEGHIDAPVEDIGKVQVSSSMGNVDFGLWQGHEVNPEFVCLLDRIMHKYPETFEHFTTRNKKLCTMSLNMLCTSLNDFTKVTMTEVDSEMIVGYKDVFAYLKNQGFNVSWALSRLNYVEHLRFSKPLVPELHAINCRVDDDKSKLVELQACVDDVKLKLQDLQARVDDGRTKLQAVQTLHMEKLTEIKKAFGTMGTNLAVGFIADDLLSSP